MAVDTPATIAILGGGPIGLEAALYARYLGYRVELFEAGNEIAPAVAKWGECEMGTPFGSNSSSLALAMLKNQNASYEPPLVEAILTGNEWRERYLVPLAQTDLIADSIHCGTRVEAIGKVELRKTDRPEGEFDRGSWDFRLLTRDSSGCESILAADLVFDCGGTFSSPLPLGHGGILAVGETALRDAIHYGVIPSELVRGKRLLIVGDDPLASFAANHEGTKSLSWFTPREREAAGPLVIRPTMSDALKSRLTRANAAALAGSIDWRSQTWIEAVRRTEAGFIVSFAGETEGEHECDEIVVCNGFRADFASIRELPLELDCASEAPRLGERGVVTSEPNYYVFGAKSLGRLGGYTHARGLEQIREAFRLIGDREGLDLYSAMER